MNLKIDEYYLICRAISHMHLSNDLEPHYHPFDMLTVSVLLYSGLIVFVLQT